MWSSLMVCQLEVTRETLFFVVPSTSARVVEYDVSPRHIHYGPSDEFSHPKLKAKAAMFTLLRSRLDEIKAREVDTTLMTSIPFPI